MQRLAWQLGQNRILIRHRHGHSSSQALRRELDEGLAVEPCGSLTIDIGDFNERPGAGRLPGALPVFPSQCTFRQNPKGTNFVTCIDGAVVSDSLAAAASARALPPVEGVQHRPVLLQVQLPVDFHSAFKWAHPPPIRLGAWSQQAAAEFDHALPCDIDRAWAVWHRAAGGGALLPLSRLPKKGAGPWAFKALRLPVCGRRLAANFTTNVI